MLSSGMPLPPDAQSTLGCVDTVTDSGTAFSRQVRSTLESSLCAAISGIGLLGLCDVQPLSEVGEELLTDALRASLLCVRMSSLSLAKEARASALSSARTCVGMFAAFALKASRQQFETLQQSVALVTPGTGTGAGSGTGTGTGTGGSGYQGHGEVDLVSLRMQSYAYATEMRRLPTALHLWAENALVEAKLHDTQTRRAVLKPLDDVSQCAVRCASVGLGLVSRGHVVDRA